MIINEFEKILTTITECKNPEIHHHQNGSHPGVRWYIKTIIPNIELITDDTYELWSMWKYLSEHFPNLIKITKVSYNWDGKNMPGWQTIWLDQRIDIRTTWTKNDGFNWKMVDFDIGLQLSGIEIEQLFENNINNRLSNTNTAQYKKIYRILEFLKTYTIDKRKDNRKKIKVIENAEIPNEAIDIE